MTRKLVECVPNFSEGRDPKKIEEIVQSMRDVTGVEVLHVDPGKETNRTVVTAIGEPEAIAEAAYRAIKKAADVIDMATHHGAHARQGSTDVCPFIPVAGVSMDECVAIARTVGRLVGEELGYSGWYYEYAATRPERRSLAYLRHGEYEGLAQKIVKPEWAPDFGPPSFNPKVGAIVIGAREFLIAYNVNLNTISKDYAGDIASDIREKGRALRRGQTTPFYTSGALVKYEPSKSKWPCGRCEAVLRSLDETVAHHQAAHGIDFLAELRFFEQNPNALEGQSVQRRGLFEHCRAVGWVIPEYNRAQISINLTNYRITPAHAVLEASRKLAADRGLIVTGSEIVGMIPYSALKESGEFYLSRQRTSRGLPFKDICETAIQSMGLSDVGSFDLKKQVLGLPDRSGKLIGMRVDELADEVSRPTPAPGGGSIAALAGSLGAALAAMVGNLAHAKPAFAASHGDLERIAMRAQELKEQLLVLVDQDTEAFQDVITANRMPKKTPAEQAARDTAIQNGMKNAARVPEKTAVLCLDVMRLAHDAAEKGLAASVTDGGVGVLMAHAGLVGATWNVLVNLGTITDAHWVSEMRKRIGDLRGEAGRILAKTEALIASRLPGC